MTARELLAAPSWQLLDSPVIVADCCDAMAAMEVASVDAIVCDPPYGLEFMGKDWDRLGGGKRRESKPGIGDRATGWVSNRGWNAMRCRTCGHLSHGGAPCRCDRPDFAAADDRMRQMQAWHERWAREALRVLRPGGHALAFGGPRTIHRLVAGLEDAGFEIRDMLSWNFGSGFPKALNLDGEWDGWATALKPAWEGITVARKPLGGTVAANVLQHGTGALHIDACRIEAEGGSPSIARRNGKAPGHPGEYGATINDRTTPERYAEQRAGEAIGRWPANVLLDEDAAELLDEQTGTLTSGSEAAGSHRSNGDEFRTADGSFEGTEREQGVLYGDSGGASRFFYTTKPSSAEREAGLGCGGVIEGARKNVHPLEPTVKPIDLMRWLLRLVTPPGGVVLDPFVGSGTTGCAAALEGITFVGVEREPEYAEIARARIAWWEQRGTGVATVAALAAGQDDDRTRGNGQTSIFDVLGEAA